MTYAVVVTVAAERDLNDIHRWIATESGSDIADRFVDKLAERVASLRDFPLRGPVPPEFARFHQTVRQASLAPYRLFYEVEETRVTIFAAMHQRREIAELLQRRRLQRD